MGYSDRLTISERTRRVRGARSASDVARSAGIAQASMSQFERAVHEPLAGTLSRIAKALNVSSDYLVGLTDDPTPADERTREVNDRVREAEERATREAEERAQEAEERAEATVARIRREEARNRQQLEAALERTEEELERLRARVGQVATDGLTDETDPDAEPIPVHRLQTAAGSGAFNLDETVKTYAYFRSEWLFRKGLAADRCNIIGVAGESMDPTLPDGCVILVDRNRTKRYRGHIFVVRTEDGLVVKRAGKDEGGGWQLVSDHPEWKPQPWPDGAEVIGEVKWMAREL